MDGSSDQDSSSCQHCGRPQEAEDVFCSGCGDRLQREPPVAEASAEAEDAEPASNGEAWDSDLRRDAETTWWSHFAGGLLLTIGSVAVFFLGLTLFGGFGAWLGGTLAFVMGSFGLAYLFGGNKTGQSL